MLQLHAFMAKRDSGTASPDIDKKALCLNGAFFILKRKGQRSTAVLFLCRLSLAVEQLLCKQ